MLKFFAEKNVSSFCSAKATHIFSPKNFRILYMESFKTVYEMTLNELVKLTTLWTTGPWSYAALCRVNMVGVKYRAVCINVQALMWIYIVYADMCIPVFRVNMVSVKSGAVCINVQASLHMLLEIIFLFMSPPFEEWWKGHIVLPLFICPSVCLSWSASCIIKLHLSFSGRGIHVL